MMAGDIRLSGYSDSVSVRVGEVCVLEVPGGHRVTGKVAQGLVIGMGCLLWGSGPQPTLASR